MVQIPVHRGPQTLLKIVARLPPQLRADPGGINRIAPVVAGVISRAWGTPLGSRKEQGLNMVFHIEPIAHVGPIAVQRYRLARHSLQDHHRDQLLGELPGGGFTEAARDPKRTEHLIGPDVVQQGGQIGGQIDSSAAPSGQDEPLSAHWATWGRAFIRLPISRACMP